MRFRPFLLTVGFLAIVACASGPDLSPLPVPDVEIQVHHRTGTTFRGRSPDLAPPTAADFDSIVASFFALERVPEGLLDPVTDHAQLFLQSGEGSVFLPAPRLLAGSRVGQGPIAEQEILSAVLSGAGGRFVEIGRATGIVARGTTASMDLRHRKPVVLPHLLQEVHEALFLDLTETPDGKGFLFSVGVRRVTEPVPELPTAGLATEATGGENETAEASRRRMVRIEAFVMDLEVARSPHAIVAVIPAGFLDESVGAIAVSILISQPPAVYSPARVGFDRQVKDFDLAREFQVAAADRDALASPVAPQVWSGLESALSALAKPGTRRSALAWIAHETGAWLAEDVALTSTDASVESVANRVLEQTKDFPRPLTPDQVGLALEQVTYGVLFEYLAARIPPPVVVGIIVRHTGEVGRHPTVLEEKVRDAKTLEELRREIRRENLILLEDSSPAVRVRAFDWLTLFGEAPEGYDPLAPREERREVMNRYLEELARKVRAE